MRTTVRQSDIPAIVIVLSQILDSWCEVKGIVSNTTDDELSTEKKKKYTISEFGSYFSVGFVFSLQL